MADGPLVERLRQYLKDLSPEARALLMTELERDVLRGSEMQGAELVLQELRRAARDSARAKRPGTLARLFFRPLEPVLVDDTATHNHPGRIARVVLEPFWEWIGRDLMPGEARAVTEQVARAFEAGDPQRAEDLTGAFQDRAVIRIAEMLNAAMTDENAEERLANLIGTPRAIEDVTAILTVIRARETLFALGEQLPRQIKSFETAVAANLKTLIEAPAAGGPALFPYVLVMTMNRLASPWQLVRLAILDSGSNDAGRIAGTRYAIAIDIVLAELERQIDELKLELRSGRGLAVGALVKGIHDGLRGVADSLAFAPGSVWGRRLAALHAKASDILRGQFETLPGRLRRLLRARPIEEIAPGSALDPLDVEDIQAQLDFARACRTYTAEFGLTDLLSQVWSEIEQFLYVVTADLAEGVRRSGDSDRTFRQSQLDAAMRFCRSIFGDDGATTRDPTSGSATGGRRVAKG